MIYLDYNASTPVDPVVREAMLPYVAARSGLIAFSTALLLFVALGGAWFSTTIASPLKTLAAASRRMISGDYDMSITVRSDDEFGELARSFNAMQSAIAEREKRISHDALLGPSLCLGSDVLPLTPATVVAREVDTPGFDSLRSWRPHRLKPATHETRFLLQDLDVDQIARTHPRHK